MTRAESQAKPKAPAAHSPDGLGAIMWPVASVLLCVTLGVIIRWPLALYPSGLPGDTNFAFHALVSHHLSQGGDPTWFDQAPFPSGFPLAVVGVVPTLLAAGLNHLTSPTVALNLVLPFNIALQAGVVMLLGAQLGWRPRAQIIAAVAATLSPVVLMFSGGSQHENVAIGAFALACLAPRRPGLQGPLLGLLALLWAAFSSPYQAVPAGLLLLASSAAVSWRALRWGLLVAALAALPVWAYYGRIGASAADSRAGMPTVGVEVSTSLTEMVWPSDIRRERSCFLDEAKLRTRQIRVRPAPLKLGEAWPRAPLWDTSYLGIMLLVLGVAGLIRGRRERPMRVAAVVGIACLLLALGSSLRLTHGHDLGFPMPWRLLRFLPLVEMLPTTARFLTGTAFALALGAGRLVAGPSHVRGWVLATGTALLLALDGLFIAPVNWPVLGFQLQVPPSAAYLPDGPVAVWPGLRFLSTNRFDLLILVLDRPVAYYGELRTSRVGSGDAPGDLEFTEIREPAEWLAGARAAGARGWLRLEHPQCTGLFQDTTHKPWFARVQERCEGGWCVGTFEDAPGGDGP